MKDLDKTEEKDKSEVNGESHKKKNKLSKKKIFKWVGIVFAIILVFGVFSFYKTNKEQAQRRANSEKQMQVMLDHWKSEGLSEEEINEKLKEERAGFNADFEPNIFQQIMFTVSRATGSDPRNGSGRVTGGGAGQGQGRSARN